MPMTVNHRDETLKLLEKAKAHLPSVINLLYHWWRRNSETKSEMMYAEIKTAKSGANHRKQCPISS
jgi:hypothetical protein